MKYFACALLAAIASQPTVPTTARTALPQAAAAAKKWHADATLTNVSSLTVNRDGSAKWWMYTFYAPGSKTSLNVTVAPGAPLDTLQVPNTSMVPIGSTFVDSDQALQEALKHDLKGSDLSMGLVVMGFTGSAVWGINATAGDDIVSVLIDGKTGAFIRREVISLK